MRVWVVYKCKRYEDVKVPYPCIKAVISDEARAKEVARADGAWMTEVEVDKIETRDDAKNRVWGLLSEAKSHPFYID